MKTQPVVRTHEAYIELLAASASINDRMAAELLELHDATGISLDDWPTARTFVRRRLLLLPEQRLTPEQAYDVRAGRVPYLNYV